MARWRIQIHNFKNPSMKVLLFTLIGVIILNSHTYLRSLQAYSLNLSLLWSCYFLCSREWLFRTCNSKCFGFWQIPIVMCIWKFNLNLRFCPYGLEILAHTNCQKLALSSLYTPSWNIIPVQKTPTYFLLLQSRKEICAQLKFKAKYISLL